jgi:hypothetical protein
MPITGLPGGGVILTAVTGHVCEVRDSVIPGGCPPDTASSDYQMTKLSGAPGPPPEAIPLDGRTEAPAMSTSQTKRADVFGVVGPPAGLRRCVVATDRVVNVRGSG